MKLDPAYQKLVECGIRPSVQRVEIMRYLLSYNTHPTIEDLYLTLKKKIPTVSKTTIYNTLRLFSEKGAANMVTIDEHRVCYDGMTFPHAHFNCKVCGQIYDIMSVEPPTDVDELMGGFIVEDAHLYYKGICPKCAEKK